MIKAQVHKYQIRFRVDTRWQARLLGMSIYRKLHGAVQLKPTNSVLRAYNGGTISCFGTCMKEVRLANTTATLMFFVVKKGRKAVLELKASEALVLVKRSMHRRQGWKQRASNKIQTCLRRSRLLAAGIQHYVCTWGRASRATS